MQASTRVIFNTGVQYGRILITVGISLYSTRLILGALGPVDYGIYNLMAGIISLLAFLNTAMSFTTQRYISIGIGRNDFNYQRNIFVNSFWLHVGVGVIVVCLSEIAGLFLFEGFLNIPAERIEVALKIYHFMIVSIFITIMNVPYTAILMAHENFLWPSVLMIVCSLLNLAIALSLQVMKVDKLLFYGIAMMVPVAINFILQGVYCFRKYQECCSLKFRYVKKSLVKELIGFVGWNLLHALCTMGTVQGMAVLLNLFFGPVVNAAYGIANQVSGQVNFFANSMLVSLNPQIIKAEGGGDRKRMLQLSMKASKWGFFLLAIVAIPCIFEMPAILNFWLKNVPEYTVIFCRLILIAILMNQLTIGLTTAVQAVGQLRVYTLIVCSIRFLVIPVGYWLLRENSSASLLLKIYILFEGIASAIRLYLLKYICAMSIKEYVKCVFKRELLPVFILILYFGFVIHFVNVELRFLFSLPLGVLIFINSIYWFGGMSIEEKETLKKLFNKFKCLLR